MTEVKDQFAQIEEDFKGRQRFIKCPHTQDRPTAGSRLINLVHESGNVITLVLCRQCCGIVADTLLDTRLSTVLDEWAHRTLPRNFFRKG